MNLPCRVATAEYNNNNTMMTTALIRSRYKILCGQNDGTAINNTNIISNKWKSSEKSSGNSRVSKTISIVHFYEHFEKIKNVSSWRLSNGNLEINHETSFGRGLELFFKKTKIIVLVCSKCTTRNVVFLMRII